MADLYLDTFTGGAGSMASHSPETPGGTYSVSGDQTLQTDGSGNVVAGGTGTGFADLAGTFNPTFPFTLELTSTSQADGSLTYFYLAADDNDYVAIRHQNIGGGETSIYRVYCNGESQAFFPEGATHTLSAEFRANGDVLVTIDGVAESVFNPGQVASAVYSLVQFRMVGAASGPQDSVSFGRVFDTSGGGGGSTIPAIVHHLKQQGQL